MSKTIAKKRPSKSQAVAACVLSTFAVISAAACGSASDSTFTGGADSGTGDNSDASGIGNGDSGDKLGGGDSGTKPTNGGDAGLNACAADTQQAKLAPLDLVFMQDTSGSMFEYTVDPTSKWDSVKTALGAFMTDPASAGIGFGLQYFPLFTGAIPNSCTTNADCPSAAGNLCIENLCSSSKGLCTTTANCGSHGGTCTPAMRCHGEQEYFCLTNGDCTGAGVPGPCDRPIERGICNGNPVSCTSSDYSALAVPVATLPGAATAVNASLAIHIPNGETPTYSALQGATQAAEAYKAAHPGDIVAVVLSTDGIPNSGGGAGCDDTTADIEGLATSAKALGVKTFVIGVLSPVDSTASATTVLNGIAAAGGTTAATILGTSSTTEADFVAALTAIRGSSLPCQFTLPVPEAGTPDYSKVNVVYTDSKTMNASIVPYVGTLADCAADAGADGGWYYDVDPFTDSGTPSKVLLCPATCGAVQADPTGKVDVVQGCKTTTTGGGPPR